MAQQQLEIARRLFEAVSERDLDQLVALTDPEVEWRSFFAVGEQGGAYRGHAGLRRYVGDLDDAWAVVKPQIDAEIEVGEVVLMVGRIRYEGKESGAGTEAAAGWMLKFRSGKVAIFRALRDPERELEALGLQGL